MVNVQVFPDKDYKSYAPSLASSVLAGDLNEPTHFRKEYTENWKDLFQPQSVNSALLAKVWFSPSWSHLSVIWAKKATSKGWTIAWSWTVLDLVDGFMLIYKLH